MLRYQCFIFKCHMAFLRRKMSNSKLTPLGHLFIYNQFSTRRRSSLKYILKRLIFMKQEEHQRSKRSRFCVIGSFMQWACAKQLTSSHSHNVQVRCVGWSVGFGLNGPLRQYFSLYRAVSQREGERNEKDRRPEKKCPNNPHPHLQQAR